MRKARTGISHSMIQASGAAGRAFPASAFEDRELLASENDQIISDFRWHVQVLLRGWTWQR